VISLYVKGFNGNYVTEYFDIWAIAVFFITLEGYSFLYNDEFFLKLIRYLRDNGCFPE